MRATEPRSERFTTEELGGVHLRALHYGDESAPPLVLLHGGGANARWWDHIAPRLGRRFHVVALDFRGHGDSDFPDDVRVGAFHDDLEALLTHLSATGSADGRSEREPVLVGHSMGGHIALDRAARGGARCLVAIDIARGGDHRERRRTRLALILRRRYATREEAIDRFRFLPKAPAASEALRRHIAGHSIREEPDGSFGFKFDPRWFGLPSRPPPPLERVTCPTLVLRGGESGLLTNEGAREVVDGMPDGALVEIAGAGHNVHLEQPEAVLRAIETFLDERA